MMIIGNTQVFRIFLLLSVVITLTACAAGDSQFTEQNPAGFWYGLWHGVISVITLVIHIFNDNVLVYEIHNTGGWYDFGFLLGVIAIWGGGGHASCKSAAGRRRDREWEEIGDKVEKKIMHKMREWAEEENVTAQESAEDWDEISEKVEKKLKRKIREWAEKD